MQKMKLKSFASACALVLAACASPPSVPPEPPKPLECPAPPPAPPAALMPWPDLQGMLDKIMQPFGTP